jgi:enoyl-CoA hydratase
VDAREAHAIGLANRVVPHGEARSAAEALALEVACFPQACLRADRDNVYCQDGTPLNAALSAEFAYSLPVIETEAVAGARRFASGVGRHGDFSGS